MSMLISQCFLNKLYHYLTFFFTLFLHIFVFTRKERDIQNTLEIYNEKYRSLNKE